MKTCRVCGREKPFTEFDRASAMRDGHRSECKDCRRTAARERYRADPESVKRRVRRWQTENRERHLEAQRRRRQRPEAKAKERAGHLRRKYGITLEDYESMLAAQGGVCAICRRPPRDDIALHVDHDHQTGARRSLLCFRCNNSLGDLEDDPELLRRAIAYLETHDPEAEEQHRRIRERLTALRT